MRARRPRRPLRVAAGEVTFRRATAAPASTRPPSSGSAGSRLKTSNSEVDVAEPRSDAVDALRQAGGYCDRARRGPPSASDTSGPAIAIRNSAPARRERARVNFATPPKSHRVMPSISMPSRLAWKAWPSSCSEQRERRTAGPRRLPWRCTCRPPSPGFVSGKTPLASVQVISAKTTSQLQLIPIRMPAMRPSEMLSPTLGD